MKKNILVLGLVMMLIMMFVMAGCKDITDTFKPGSFGKTPQENAMVEAMVEKYGDLTKGGSPRFLEVMMTTNVESFIPVDRVTKYNKNTPKLFAWFVYDNFNEDDLEIEWVYLDNNYSIHTFKSKTGKDFGRGSFILEQPDNGWVTGNYKVVIRGRGIQETVPFEIIEGATVAVPLRLPNGKIALSTPVLSPTVNVTTAAPVSAASPSPTVKPSATVSPGWYFTRWEYIISKVDVTLVGAIESSVMGTSGKIYDYNKGEGDKNDFSVSLTRKYENGGVVASGSCTTTWTDPQEFIAAGQKASFTVKRSTGSSWGINKMSASVDKEDILPGYASAGRISFTAPDGNGYLENYEGIFEAEKGMAKGTKGEKKAVIVTLGNGYGFKYYYEWRE